jgi:serine/threonine protein kinase
MSEAMPWQPEQVLARGRFVLVKRLGRGGMGEVWLARDERLREPVALKFLPPEIRGDPGALEDLCRETARSHRLTHSNIVRIHDLYEDPDGTAFIVMEYVDGPTLATLRAQQPGGVLPWDYLRPLVAQLCAALEYAHGERVIHRDLKPANLMVDSRGRLKLADFGIAAVASDSMSRVSMKHSTSGTLPYMSPQQLTGQRPQAADDIYALGATLYELLTGKPPFYSGDITHQVLNQAPEPMQDRLAALEIQNEIPPDAAALIMACLGKEPGQRPQSARMVAEWIGLELEAKQSAGSLAAAFFPEGPSSPAAVAAGEPVENVCGTRPGHGRAASGLWPAPGYARKVGAVGIVLLVLAAAFWLRKDIFRRDHSNVPVSAKASAPTQINPNATDRINQVKQLYDEGLISKADYDRKVKEIMDSH